MAGAVASAFPLLCERFYACGVSPNTRKCEEALVGAYFGIYDGSLTARNKGTRTGGRGAAGQWVIRGAVYRNRQGGSGKTGGWFRERGESNATHPLLPFPTYRDGI